MIGLVRGQKDLVEYQIQSKIGSGKLHLLNTGIKVDIQKKGLGLELGYDEIIRVHAEKKDVVIIQWVEGIATYDLKMHVKDASELVSKITQFKNESVQLAAFV
ncbi:MAG: hypothetical protein KGI05_01710 [Thaumarchaeota archaeon]|nr:hypothetical protein [Nitrososphaerota archaeon]